MTITLDTPPGTVSKLLWHFTGGPRWNSKTKRQGTTPKAPTEAYTNLLSILDTRQIRLGSYIETVRVILPEVKYLDRDTGKTEIFTSVPVEIESAKVCCLSDIPAAHLGYHANRYGKFAIGFHRDAAVRHGFNPVLYSLENTGVVRSIYNGFAQLEGVEPWNIITIANEIEDAIDRLGENADIEVSSAFTDIELNAENITDSVWTAREALREFVAFVKTFQEDEFSTIYCEREWRALRTYCFDYADVALIVLPKRISSRKYYEEFVTKTALARKIPRTVPVVPWEDLVEH